MLDNRVRLCQVYKTNPKHELINDFIHAQIIAKYLQTGHNYTDYSTREILIQVMFLKEAAKCTIWLNTTHLIFIALDWVRNCYKAQEMRTCPDKI